MPYASRPAPTLPPTSRPNSLEVGVTLLGFNRMVSKRESTDGENDARYHSWKRGDMTAKWKATLTFSLKEQGAVSR